MVILVLAFLAFLAPDAPAASIAASERAACEKAQGDLEGVLYGLPRACKRDSDCDGYYYREDVSPRAVVLTKPGVPPDLEAQLLAAQDAQRVACATQLARGKAVWLPFKARCFAARCEDAKAVWRRTLPLWERLLGSKLLWFFVLANSLLGFAFGRYRSHWEGADDVGAYPAAQRLSRWAGVFMMVLLVILLITKTNFESRAAVFVLAGAALWIPVLSLAACGFVRPWIYLAALLFARLSR